MIDYDCYEMKQKDYLIFYGAGYLCFFSLGYVFYKNFYLSMAIGLLIVAFKNTYITYKVNKRKERLLQGFKDLLYSLSTSVSTGRSMAEGIREGYENLKTIYPEESDIVRELKILRDGIFDNKGNEAALLNDFSERTHIEDIISFTDVYNSVRSTGGNVESVIEKTSNVIMEKINIDKEIKTVVSQKKMESAIIASMPIVIIAGMNFTGSSYLDPMYETFNGRLIMTFALIGIALSFALIIKLTDIRV